MHYITKLIVTDARGRCTHDGVSLTFFTLRDECLVLIRSIIHHCVSCAKIKASIAKKLIGSLLAPRVQCSIRTFEHCGVDYAGSLKIRLAGGRGIEVRSACIAVFICLAVKAVFYSICM